MRPRTQTTIIATPFTAVPIEKRRTCKVLMIMRISPPAAVMKEVWNVVEHCWSS